MPSKHVTMLMQSVSHLETLLHTKAVSNELQQGLCANNTTTEPCLYDVIKAHLWVPICIGEVPNMHYKVHIIVYHIPGYIISSGASPATMSAYEWRLCCSTSVCACQSPRLHDFCCCVQFLHT